MPINITPGSCFLLPIPNNDYKHLFVVIANLNPSTGSIVIVSITTIDSDKCDKTTKLDIGDHPFIKHASYVNYYNARIIGIDRIQELISNQKAFELERMNPDLLKRIISGVTQSNKTKYEIREIFMDFKFTGLNSE